MNYKKIYESLILRAKNRDVIEGYTEKHHILPVCIGGDSSKENIVRLTPEEHYLAHQLLVKMFPKGSAERQKLIYAARAMAVFQDRRSNNKLYGWVRREHANTLSALYKGVGNPMYGKTPWNKFLPAEKQSFYGRKHTETTKTIISEKNAGQKNGMFQKKPWNKGLVGDRNHRFGSIQTEETKEKIRAGRVKFLQENPKEMIRLKEMAKNRTPEHQQKINEANRGQKRTIEQKVRMSKAHIGKRMNEENKKSKRCSILGNIFPSVREAHRVTGIDLRVLYNRINNPDYEDYYYL